MKKLFTLLLLLLIVSKVNAQGTITTEKVRGLEIVKPTIENFVAVLEMPSSDWLKYCKSIGYVSESPYTSPRTGYLLMNKGKVGEGGSSHISKLGSKKILFEWYHRDNDPKTIFTNTLIQLENNIVKTESDAVLYFFTHKGNKYSALFLSGGSQTGFMIEKEN